MAVINWAIEVDSGGTATDSDIALTGGFFRFITGRPGYTTAPYPTGDNSNIVIAIDGLETMAVSFASGQLYQHSNGTFKSANTVPSNLMRFTNTGTNDFTGGELLTAKGSALAAGDMFLITDNTPASEVIEYIGSNIWYQDWIVKDGVGQSTRSIDLSRTGDYGTLSGFNFTIRNNEKFWKELDDAAIYLANKEVRKYCIIDDVFYQVWTGIVGNNPRDDIRFIFKCIDNFRTIHKIFPPNEITKTDFTDVPNSSNSDTIPVCIGEIPKAKIIDIESKRDSQTLVIKSATNYYTAKATQYDESDINKTEITLYTLGQTFTANQLNNGKYYIRVVIGKGNAGDDADTEETVQVIDNDVTSGDLTKFYLAAPIKNLDDNSATALSTASTSTDDEVWYFQLDSYEVTHIVSNDTINEYKKTSSNDTQLWFYNDEDKVYKEQGQLLLSSDTTTGGAFGYPNIGIRKPVVSIDGDIVWTGNLTPVIGSNFQFGTDGTTASNPVPTNNIIDKDRTTYDTYQATSAKSVEISYDITIPDEIINSDIEEMYFCADVGIAPAGGSGYNYIFNIDMYDVYNGTFKTDVITGQNGNPTTMDDYPLFNYLPNTYYLPDGDDDSQDSLWNSQKDNFKISSDVFDNIRKGYALNKLKCKIELTSTSNATLSIVVYQLGMIIRRKVNVTDGDAYTSLDGEKIGSDSTNTVYKAFRLMLETYDSLSTDKIDYGNLSTRRDNWYVGRQITQRKSSFEYIRELCRQSFCAIFPTRKGYRKFSAWRDDTTSTATHDESAIIRNSIRKAEKTKLSDMFNDFKIEYHFNPATQKYDRSFFVTNVDQAAFPAVGGDWKKYVGGLDSSGYADSENIWEQCNAAYLRTGVIQQATTSISKMNWYLDRSEYDADETNGIGTESSAWRYLVNCVEWLGRQKEPVSYSLPVDATNVLTELCNHVTFNDQIYTDNSDRVGWITQVTFDPKSDIIKIETLLDPDDGITAGGDIIESGSQTDTYTESGSQTDTVTEGA